MAAIEGEPSPKGGREVGGGGPGHSGQAEGAPEASAEAMAVAVAPPLGFGGPLPGSMRTMGISAFE